MTSTPQDVQTQFVIEIPGDLAPFVKRHRDALMGAVGNGLLVLFGLPFGTPHRISAVFSERWQLLEVNGVTSRTPDDLEVQGCLTGAFVATLTLLGSTVSAVDLLKERVTDA